MAAASQAETLPLGVKPTVPEAFKGSMDNKTILNFIHHCNLCFRLVSMSNRNIQALFTVRLLKGPGYTCLVI